MFYPDYNNMAQPPYGVEQYCGMPMQSEYGMMPDYCGGQMPYQGGVLPGMSGMPPGYGYGHGMVQNYGMQCGFVKYTRPQLLDGLRNYVLQCTQGRVPISREEKLEETPQFLRHACAECGISRLQMLTFNVPEAGIVIPFYFCTACGKLFYYRDFMG